MGIPQTFVRRVWWLLRWVPVVLVATAAAGAAIQAIQSARDWRRVGPKGQLVDVGGFRLHIHCEGAGSPVVVMDAGMGDSSLVWRDLQPQVAALTRVCTYDRAGYGYSDEGPTPRDSARIVNELHALLDRTGVRPPLVLVGHSFGGMNVRLFAYTLPDTIAGLVLVDPSHEDQRAQFPASAAVRFDANLSRSCANAQWARFGLMRLRGITAADTTSVPPAVLDEAVALGYGTPWFRAFCEELRTFTADSAAQLREARRPISIPMVVIDGYYTAAAERRASGETPEDAAQWEAVWHRLHRELAEGAPNGRLVLAEKSSHNVHLDQPDVVLSAVAQVVDAARRTGPNASR